MNMEHRQVWKNSMYEASERVPLIIAGPGVPQGVVVTNLTSLLDVYPTLMSMVGGVIPSYLEGHTLMPWLVDEQKALTLYSKEMAVRPDWVTAQYHSNMGNTGSFMLRQVRPSVSPLPLNLELTQYCCSLGTSRHARFLH